MDLSPPTDFGSASAALGAPLSAEQLTTLQHFVQLLLEANQRFNLTTIRDPKEAWNRHVLDSLSLVPHLAELPARARVVDIGSGGGLPGIVLAIACPQLRFTLIDATGKKVHHIAETAHALALGNVDALQGRAEDLARSGAHHRERYQLAVARALAPLPVLLELAIPFVTSGGHFLAIKGQRAAEELQAAQRALQALHTEMQSQHPTSTGIVLKFSKLKSTPEKYPRRPGEPKRSPLGT